MKIGNLIRNRLTSDLTLGIVYNISDDTKIARDAVVTFYSVMWSSGLCGKYSKIHFDRLFEIISEA